MRTETVTQTIENIDVHVLAAYTAHRSVEIEQQAVCCEVIALTSMYKRLVQGTRYALRTSNVQVLVHTVYLCKSTYYSIR